MEDMFGTPLEIGDIVVAHKLGYNGKLEETFRCKLVDVVKKQSNGIKVKLERIDFYPYRAYLEKDKTYVKYTTSIIKYSS